MLDRKYHLVVGGGIAGILTAFLLVKKGVKVILYERESVLGGLLNSKTIDGKTYDYGTHILQKTGIPDIDNFFFQGLETYEIKKLRTASYFKSYFESNGFLSDQSLGKSTQKDCLKELIEKSAAKRDKEYKNLEEQLVDIFGKGYFESLLEPAITKFYFKRPADLAPNSHLFFGLSRLIVADETKTKLLKQDTNLDQLIAFHSYLDGTSSVSSLYPKQGGVGSWINFLEAKLNALGVTVIKGGEMSIDREEDKIVRFGTSGQLYPIDEVFWTIPPVFLYDLVKRTKPKTALPERLSVVVVDVECSSDYLTKAYYVNNYDPDLESFRITLYDNYAPSTSGDLTKRITVEFLTNQLEIDLINFERIAEKELFMMGLVPTIESVKAVGSSVVKGGFPVLTDQFLKDSKRILQGLAELKNVRFFGKSAGKTWFMKDVMMQIYNDLKDV